MSAVLAQRLLQPRDGASPTFAVVLLGTGVVGGALLKLLNTAAADSLRLVGAANSRRQQTDPARLNQRNLREQLNLHGDPRDDGRLLAALDASDAPFKVIIDASASGAVAGRHAEWLARGYHVITANKALAGGELAGWCMGSMPRPVRGITDRHSSGRGFAALVTGRVETSGGLRRSIRYRRHGGQLHRPSGSEAPGIGNRGMGRRGRRVVRCTADYRSGWRRGASVADQSARNARLGAIQDKARSGGWSGSYARQ